MTKSTFLSLTGSVLISAVYDAWTKHTLVKYKVILENNLLQYEQEMSFLNYWPCNIEQFVQICAVTQLQIDTYQVGTGSFS